jgi:hypothetical protein
MIVQFEFTDLSTYLVPANSFVLRVPTEIKSKVDLFSVLAKEGEFPEYFGANWDALLDCLCDFSWVSERKIIIIHEDVPLLSSMVDCFNYLDSLRIAVDDWMENEGATGNESSIDHQLLVIFPSVAKSTVLNLLQNK